MVCLTDVWLKWISIQFASSW